MIEYENLYLFNKEFINEYKTAFEEVISSGWFILGKQVELFEQSFAETCRMQHCIGVASGLDALFLSLKAIDYSKEKTEVIVASNAYVASILSIINAGLKPVLVEPDINTYNLDPLKIEEHISKRTLAIMPVHLYGKVCDMKSIVEIAKKYKLFTIEDCAQAHGATYKNKIAGSFGHFGAYSFYPTKNLGALGDAGAVVTNEDEYAHALKRLRNYGSDKKYYNEIIGFNSRLDEIQAAFLQIKLKKLNKIIVHKKKLAAIYNGFLKECFIKPAIHPDYSDVYHIYAIRHARRDLLKKYLYENGIKTEIHYPLAPYQQNALKIFFSGQKFPVSDEIHSCILSLPISYFHSEEEILKVCEVMNKF